MTDHQDIDFAKVLRELPEHPNSKAWRKNCRAIPLSEKDEQKLFRWQLEMAANGDREPIITELRRRLELVRIGGGFSARDVLALIDYFEGKSNVLRGRGRPRAERWHRLKHTPGAKMTLRKERAVRDYRIVAAAIGIGQLRGRKQRLLAYIADREGLALSALENAVGRSAKIANK